MKTIYDFTVNDSSGKKVVLSKYKGKVLLIVNVASKCGFTPQYDGLQKLYEEFHPQGLEILGFPCNQFRKQESGSQSEINQFCKLNYGVTFPVFEKIDVNADNAHPLYQFLKKEKPGIFGTKSIKWNFTKFTADRSGKIVSRHASLTTPAGLKKHIQKLLAEKISPNQAD